MIELDYKLAFIIPYRNREQHLSAYVHHYKRIFPDADIYVVHQLGTKPFNRGSLLNIGFLYAEHRADAFDLSDVDMLAVEDNIDYSFPSVPAHLASEVSQFGYQMPYPAYFSGHVLLTGKHMRAVNGFSNDYAGYGCEDDCFYRSFLAKNIPVERRVGRYESLEHESVVANDTKMMELFNRNWEKFNSGPRNFENGLTSCRYWIDKVHPFKDYTQIDVVLR